MFLNKSVRKSSSLDTSCNQMGRTESKEHRCLRKDCILLWEVGTLATRWDVHHPLRFCETTLPAVTVIVHIPCLSLLHFHIFRISNHVCFLGLRIVYLVVKDTHFSSLVLAPWLSSIFSPSLFLFFVFLSLFCLFAFTLLISLALWWQIFNLLICKHA